MTKHTTFFESVGENVGKIIEELNDEEKHNSWLKTSKFILIEGGKMKIISTFGEMINGSFTERNRATGIVLNDKKEIILMNLTNMHFHMLPGGGVDLNENIEEALYREVKEETGANVEIISDLGVVVENLEQRKMKQITYFYLTKAVGEIEEPNFMPDELEQGYQVEWFSIDEAIKILEEENEYEEYIKQRELVAIKEVKKYLEENNL